MQRSSSHRLWPAGPLLMLALAACGDRAGSGSHERVAESGFVPPVTRAPEPIAGQRNGTPLTAYIGHYPRDAVGGVAFFDRTEVANALVEVVPDEALRHEITGREATQVPVFRMGTRIAAHGCAPHDCAAHHWTVMVAADGDIDRATVCVHDAASMGETSRWRTRAGTTTRPGACPEA